MPPQQRSSALATRAAGLAADGFRVFPLQSNGKRPITDHGLFDASDDVERVADWWRWHPEANVGIRTGDGLLVVDIDCKAADGEQSWQELLDAHNGGEPLITRVVLTPHAGRHLYFQLPDGVVVGNTATGTPRALAPGIDTRADGGYAVAAGVIDGKAYDTISEPVAPAPPWLVELLGERDGDAQRSRKPRPRSTRARGATRT